MKHHLPTSSSKPHLLQTDTQVSDTNDNTLKYVQSYFLYPKFLCVYGRSDIIFTFGLNLNFQFFFFLQFRYFLIVLIVNTFEFFFVVTSTRYEKI